MKKYLISRKLLLLLTLPCFIGCSETTPYELAEVRGAVTLDGKPVTNQEGIKFKVMFTPVAKKGELKAGKPGFGILSDDGTYTLSSYGNEDGAVVGQHWVTLIRTHLATGDSPENFKAAKFVRYRLPTPITVEPDVENVIDLSVRSDYLGG